jgi:hypothetical protein
VRNRGNNSLENFAIHIYRIEAATYQGIVDELGAECVDKSLWENVPEGGAIFFYAFRLEKEFIKGAEESKGATDKKVERIKA